VIEALLGMTRHLVVLLGIVIACSFPTLLTSEAPNEIDFERKSVAPNGDDPMGTDEMGRDLMARVLYGGASPSGRRWPLPSARWRSRPCGQRCRPMPGGSSTR
jgi:hypothetical protein